MNLLDSAAPIVSTLLGLLKIAAMVGIPLAVLVFFCWFMFIRWSQHGVDL